VLISFDDHAKTDKRQNITIIPFADMHTGGYTALHPNVRKVDGQYKSLTEIGGWFYRNNNHFYLSSKQVGIWNHFETCLSEALKIRGDNKLVLINAGDSTDGKHHHTNQLVTQNPEEQKDTHVELFQYVKERLAYRRGDELYIVDGTEVHTGDTESSIGEQLGAYQYSSGLYSTPFLEMNINGVLVWVYHQGVSAGDHPNKGNPLMNAMKRIYYSCLANGKPIPSVILSAHTHNPDHKVYIQEGHEMHYIVLPSWQDKTRFANDKMALAINRVGLQVLNISAEGEIKVFAPMLMESPRGEFITIE
jgi:hypothetical protein